MPARPQFVQILRTVISGMAARLDFPYDAIEDLKIAVDEACGQLLPLRPAELTLRISEADRSVEATVSADVEVPVWPPDGAERSLAWQVLSGLTDDAKWERTDEGPALRLVKRVGATG